MKAIYKYASSKVQILISFIVLILIIICSLFVFFYKVNSVSDIFFKDAILTVGELFYFSIILLLLIQAIFNIRLYINGYNNETLEINNTEQYLFYTTQIKGQIKTIKASYDNIYLIKRYKATFINLYYYEVFYTENDVVRKIVVSISLAPGLERKIKKKIKLIKEEHLFCSALPEPESWIR